MLVIRKYLELNTQYLLEYLNNTLRFEVPKNENRSLNSAKKYEIMKIIFFPRAGKMKYFNAVVRFW